MAASGDKTYIHKPLNAEKTVAVKSNVKDQSGSSTDNNQNPGRDKQPRTLS